MRVLGSALALLLLSGTALARESAAMLVQPTWVSPLRDGGQVSDSLGGGVEMRMLFGRDPMSIHMGGFYAMGQRDGDKKMRDIYDFHFSVAFEPGSSERKMAIPYISAGLDVLHMDTRFADNTKIYRGTTLGMHAQAGLMGHLGDWFYAVNASYLGAIVPGTGDDLGGLVVQAGLGMWFDP